MLSIRASDVEPSPLLLLSWRDIPHPERAVSRGELVAVRRGTYADAREWMALAPWDRYLARVHAAASAFPGTVFCLESAASLLGMPIFGEPPEVHVLTPPSAASRSTGGLRTHRSGEERTIVERGGIFMTDPSETAVDLARLRHPAIGWAMTDAALRLDPRSSAERLAGINESRASSRGRRRAREPIARATPKPETALESLSLAVIHWLGFSAPELQVTFPGGQDRSDFVWPDERIAGEADGELKYDGRYGDPRAALRARAERDSRLRRHVRSVQHWGWWDATNVAPLRAQLRGAGLRPVARESVAPLASLRTVVASRAPRSV